MKYLVADFVIANADGTALEDAQLMQAARDVLCTTAGEAGFESFEETDNGLKGYVQAGALERDMLDFSLENFLIPGLSVTYELSEMEDKDWNEEWENAGFEPIDIDGKCVICDTKHQPEADDIPLKVVIDARQAFGTGTHETTRMVVSRLLQTPLEGRRVLDCGCGTGILSLVASMLGAARVTGYDIDEWSVDNTLHNASLNHVDNLDVLLGDVSVLSHVCGTFDVVLANINRNILLADMPHLKEVMSHEALLVVSGFYAADAQAVASRAGELGLQLEATDCENDWSCLTFRNG